MLTQEKNDKMKLIVLNSLDDKGVKSLKIQMLLLKLGKLRVLQLQENYVIYVRNVAFALMQTNCMVQCIRDFNGVIDGVDILEGFTVAELRDLLNMASVS